MQQGSQAGIYLEIAGSLHEVNIGNERRDRGSARRKSINSLGSIHRHANGRHTKTTKHSTGRMRVIRRSHKLAIEKMPACRSVRISDDQIAADDEEDIDTDESPNEEKPA